MKVNLCINTKWKNKNQIKNIWWHCIIFDIISDCPKDNYVCKNKECVHIRKWCDGVVDCKDNSDEGRICQGETNKDEFISSLLFYNI